MKSKKIYIKDCMIGYKFLKMNLRVMNLKIMIFKMVYHNAKQEKAVLFMVR